MGHRNSGRPWGCLEAPIFSPDSAYLPRAWRRTWGARGLVHRETRPVNFGELLAATFPSRIAARSSYVSDASCGWRGGDGFCLFWLFPGAIAARGREVGECTFTPHLPVLSGDFRHPFPATQSRLGYPDNPKDSGAVAGALF